MHATSAKSVEFSVQRRSELERTPSANAARHDGGAVRVRSLVYTLFSSSQGLGASYWFVFRFQVNSPYDVRLGNKCFSSTRDEVEPCFVPAPSHGCRTSAAILRRHLIPKNDAQYPQSRSG
eukprot:364632-Chlamydomonas_euryale.AAC.5